MNAWVLTSLARVKEYIGGSFTSVQETKLEHLIDSVSDFIESYCDRRFIKTTYTREVYDGIGSEFLTLRNYPIVGSTTLEYRNTTENEVDWTTIDAEDYFIDTKSGVIRLTGNSRFQRFAAGAYAATYTAGWDFNNSTVFLATYAADLEYVVWEMVKNAYEGILSGKVQSETIGDYSVTYTKMVFGGLTTDGKTAVQTILDKYKRMEVAGIYSPVNY